MAAPSEGLAASALVARPRSAWTPEVGLCIRNAVVRPRIDSGGQLGARRGPQSIERPPPLPLRLSLSPRLKGGSPASPDFWRALSLSRTARDDPSPAIDAHVDLLGTVGARAPGEREMMRERERRARERDDRCGARTHSPAAPGARAPSLSARAPSRSPPRSPAKPRGRADPDLEDASRPGAEARESPRARDCGSKERDESKEWGVVGGASPHE
jgi:hypothetical protein